MSLGLNFMLCCKWSHFLWEEIRSYLFHSSLLSPGKFWANALELAIGKMKKKENSLWVIPSLQEVSTWQRKTAAWGLLAFPLLAWNYYCMIQSKGYWGSCILNMLCPRYNLYSTNGNWADKGGAPHFMTALAWGLSLETNIWGSLERKVLLIWGRKPSGWELGEGGVLLQQQSCLAKQREGWGDAVVLIHLPQTLTILAGFS